MGLTGRRLWWAALPLALVLVLGGGALAVGRWLTPAAPAAPPLAAMPPVVVTLADVHTIAGTPPVLPWPATGQATVEVAGLGSLGSSGAVRPVPIASVAKVMTAYLVLRDHPLRPADDGPALTVSAQEAAAYDTEAAGRQSLVRVAAGEVLTERQALEALLLPSADNIARLLARWDAGDPATFVAAMNAQAAALGMADTRYTDPSGLDRATVSTAPDQLRLAERALTVPAFAQLVALPEATIPVAGVIRNYNTLLGQDGIIGIKTGSTNAAGGCLLFAARLERDGQVVTIVGAVLGQAAPTAQLLPAVLAAAQRLVEAAETAIQRYVVVPAGTTVAWVRGRPLVTVRDLTVTGWPGLTVHPRVRVTATGGTVDIPGATSTPVRAG